MTTWRTLIFFLFWITLLIDCFFIVTQHDDYRLYSKTLLVPLLLIAIYIDGRNTKHNRSKLLANGALFFCFLGDVFLIQDDNSGNFVFGLMSFLIAHIFFIIFFYRLKKFKAKYVIFNFICGLAITIYISLLILYLWKGVSMQNFEIPVIVYSMILGLMLFCALNTYKNRSMKRIALRYFIPGAIFFVISDSLLAIDKFSIPFNYSGVPIMLTYGTAIFLLTDGITHFLKK